MEPQEDLRSLTGQPVKISLAFRLPDPENPWRLALAPLFTTQHLRFLLELQDLLELLRPLLSSRGSFHEQLQKHD